MHSRRLNRICARNTRKKTRGGSVVIDLILENTNAKAGQLQSYSLDNYVHPFDVYLLPNPLKYVEGWSKQIYEKDQPLHERYGCQRGKAFCGGARIQCFIGIDRFMPQWNQRRRGQIHSKGIDGKLFLEDDWTLLQWH